VREVTARPQPAAGSEGEPLARGDALGGTGWRALAVFFAGFVLIWLVLDQSATRTGSLYGQAGLFVGAATVATAVAVEVLLFRRPPRRALRELGYGRPAPRALVAALVIGLLLLASLPLLALLTGTSLALRADWWWLAPGLFAQHGLAEETLFRGYAFRHLRVGRGFWRAAALSLVPFVAIHVLLLAVLPLSLALTSVLVAVAFAFPAAYLFDGGRGTVWAPAGLHFAAHLPKLAEPEGFILPLQLAWSVAVLALPFLAFAFRLRAPPGAAGPLPGSPDKVP
jgi:membrane protease YdiL (CAAX protease family)